MTNSWTSTAWASARVWAVSSPPAAMTATPPAPRPSNLRLVMPSDMPTRVKGVAPFGMSSSRSSRHELAHRRRDTLTEEDLTGA